MKRVIKETKATCQACSKVWHYGKLDELMNAGAAQFNAGKAMMCCGGCIPALLIPDKKVIDYNKCPECGSSAVTKEIVEYAVE